MKTAFKQVTDNAIANISTVMSSTGLTSLTVATGKGSKFPQPGNGFIGTIWDNVVYPNNPGADPNMEKVTCTARSGDVLTTSPTGNTHSATSVIALLDVAQNTTDLQTAVNTLEETVDGLAEGGGSSGGSDIALIIALG